MGDVLTLTIPQPACASFFPGPETNGLCQTCGKMLRVHQHWPNWIFTPENGNWVCFICGDIEDILRPSLRHRVPGE